MDVLIASWIPRYQFLDITRCSSKEAGVVISFHFFDTGKRKNSLFQKTSSLYDLSWKGRRGRKKRKQEDATEAIKKGGLSKKPPPLGQNQ
ncbi:hypothetical protein V1478_006693 [Vespula squamosa]|uniref:Uncharacterized protein n=1 Tax=Vespula squamosa TaxID=30214 RepID=A0ABD2B1C9_VESSQ